MIVGLIVGIVISAFILLFASDEIDTVGGWIATTVGCLLMTALITGVAWGVHISVVKDTYRDVAFQKYTYEAALSSGMLIEDEIETIISESCTINSNLEEMKENINKWYCFDIPKGIKEDVENAEYIEYIDALNSADYYRLMKAS